MPGRAVPGLRAGAVRVQPAPKSESKVGRWESPHDPAHDDDHVLAPDGTPMSAQQFMELLFGKLRGENGE
jgi:hypothetical protein